jgi:hypothetical protein
MNLNKKNVAWLPRDESIDGKPAAHLKASEPTIAAAAVLQSQDTQNKFD